MSRDIRYLCKQHGPFLATATVGPGHKAPRQAICPKCDTPQPRLHRRKPSGHAISVRGETYARLVIEAERRDVPMRRIVEDITKDIV